MNYHVLKYFALILVILGGISFGASAQGETAGTLTLGQPAISQINSAGETVEYDYVLSEASQVTLQALADSAPPMITILQNGALVAREANPQAALTISLSVFLDAGSYTVQVGAVGEATGLVVLVLQSESPVTSTFLTPGIPVEGSVNQNTPFALYNLDALAEPAYLYVDTSGVGGIHARLVFAADATVKADIDPTMLGARWQLPGDSATYQVEIQVGDATVGDAPFTLCLAAVSTGGCETNSVPPPPQATEEVVEILPPSDFCTVSSSVGIPVNIRQSASTNAIILASLPVGGVADVIGISPDRTFYNVLFSGSNGWVAVSVVATSGNCDNILTINPPTVVEPQQQAQAPAAVPTDPPTPEQPIAPPAPPTPSGPCLITLTAPTYVYQVPLAVIDYLQDQVQAGELVPVGKLADNSWWRTNYANAWIQTSTFGVSAQVSGNCDTLPVIQP